MAIAFWKSKKNYHPITMLPSLESIDKSKRKNKELKNGTKRNKTKNRSNDII